MEDKVIIEAVEKKEVGNCDGCCFEELPCCDKIVESLNLTHSELDCFYIYKVKELNNE